MARSNAYWKKRFEQIEQSHNMDALACLIEIEKQYRQAQKQLEATIAAWYLRFAQNNNITLAEAKTVFNQTIKFVSKDVENRIERMDNHEKKRIRRFRIE